MPKTSMLLPRDLIIPALHHATAVNNVRSQNLRHTARIYAISIAKRVTENGVNSNFLSDHDQVSDRIKMHYFIGLLYNE